MKVEIEYTANKSSDVYYIQEKGRITDYAYNRKTEQKEDKKYKPQRAQRNTKNLDSLASLCVLSG